ncbi:hypothetical protein C7271_19795 [filamentous cyanobacterium CCP5]|nr:hypothetical protein C7271_19795 [filamentous cyanobacterium CCP5]
MSDSFPLAPRYRLDDGDAWLVGIDPLRRYWVAANGDDASSLVIPGLSVADFELFRDLMLAFRNMRSGDSLPLPTAVGVPLLVTCVSKNCFLVESAVDGCPASHLFDQEALESLLMTAHPDWRCAPHHKDLGNRMLSLAWEKPAVIGAA